MAPIRIGLMGFGRIGRNLFRILHERDDIQVGAISDIADPASLEYLLRFDTLLGRFPGEPSVRGEYLYSAGRQIPMLQAADPGQVDWAGLDVDVVVEATARSRTRSELERHLERGARRVVLCAPPSTPPDLTVVMGVNDHLMRDEHRIVSNASCTAHCVAPILQILHGAFGIRRGMFSTSHAYTNKQRLADVPDRDKRGGRAAAENIIPQPSNSARVVSGLIPELEGRLSGMAMNVPIPNGSVVDLVCWHEKPVSVEAINEVVRTAAASRWSGIVDYEHEPIVSSDILRSPFSSTFDSLATMVLDGRVSKTLSWYDNGWGYSHRVLDLVKRFAEIEREAA